MILPLNARTALCVAALLGGLSCPAFCAQPIGDLEHAFAQAADWQWTNSRAPLVMIEDAVIASTRDQSQRAALERRLVDLLLSRPSTASKDFICRQLSVIGTSNAVPALAALLPEPNASHMARFALERIRSAEAIAALRQALKATDGATQIGIINSLGVLQDAAAVPDLTQMARHSEPSIASAAIAALGVIGTDAAVAALGALQTGALSPLRAVVRDAQLTAAQKLLRRGKRAEAAAVYEALFNRETGAIRLSAFEGLVQARPTEASQLLQSALASPDDALRESAGRIISNRAEGPPLQPFTGLLPTLAVQGQAVLLDAFAVRADPAARPAIVSACDSPSMEVRLAAIRALGRIGTADDVMPLAQIASVRGSASGAARLALATLPGREPSRVMEERLESAEPPIAIVLMEALSARAASDSAPAVAARLRHPEERVRQAAIAALGGIGSERELPLLIATVKSTAPPAELDAALAALDAIVRRRGAASRPALIAGLSTTANGASLLAKRNGRPVLQSDRGTPILLQQLGRVGGSDALAIVQAALNSDDPALNDAAFRALCDWPDWEAGPELLAAAQTTDSGTRLALAVRGFVRVCQDAPLPPEQRLKWLRQAAELPLATDESILLISALAEVPEPGALELLARYLEQPALSDAAAVAVIKVCGGLTDKTGTLPRQVLRVIAERSTNPDTRKQATGLLQKLAGATGKTAP